MRAINMRVALQPRRWAPGTMLLTSPELSIR